MSNEITNENNFVIIANALYNKSGIVKLVEKETGIWHDLNVNKVLNYDYDELCNLQKIFSLAKPGDNQIMLSKKLALTLIDKFKDKYSKPNREILSQNNFKEVAEIVISQHLFNTPDETKSLSGPFKEMLTNYQNHFMKGIVEDILLTSDFDETHKFYDLSKQSQKAIVLYIVTYAPVIKHGKSGLQVAIEKFGLEKTNIYIEEQKSFAFLKKLFFEYGGSLKEHGEAYLELFKSDIEDSHIKTLLKDSLTKANIEAMEFLEDKYSHLFKELVTEENYINLISKSSYFQVEKIFNFTKKYFPYDIWLNDSVVLKRLYHENKTSVAERIYKSCEFDYDSYLKFRDFLFKRGTKDSKKMKDLEHFEKQFEIQAMEAQLEREIPSNNISGKKIKF